MCEMWSEKQGCVKLSWWFNIFLDKVVKALKEETMRKRATKVDKKEAEQEIR